MLAEAATVPRVGNLSATLVVFFALGDLQVLEGEQFWKAWFTWVLVITRDESF